MNENWKSLLAMRVASVVTAGLLLVTPSGCAIVELGIALRQTDRERATILYNTDHATLLAACRVIMTNRQSYATDVSVHGPEDPRTSFIDPNDPRVPPIVRSLPARCITATDESVVLDVHGGFDHYGVLALSGTAVTNGTGRYSAPVVLVPGLVYLDEGLGYDRDRWMRKLRAMKPRDAPEPSWWRTPE